MLTPSPSELEALLLDNSDGACRDVNFETPTWTGVDRTFALLGRMYSGHRVDWASGDLHPFPSAALQQTQQEDSFVHVTYTGGKSVLSRLQVYLAPDDDGTPFVELTFFPEDLRHEPNLAQTFALMIDEIRQALGSVRAFVRLESGSWKMGDAGDGSGVFLVLDGTSLGALETVTKHGRD